MGDLFLLSEVSFAYDTILYRQRHKVDNLFAKLKDWRRTAAGYDRCAHNLLLGHLHRNGRHLLDLINVS